MKPSSTPHETWLKQTGRSACPLYKAGDWVMWLFLIALGLAVPVVEDVLEWIRRRGSKRDLVKMIEHRKLGHAFDPTSGKWPADQMPSPRSDGSPDVDHRHGSNGFSGIDLATPL